MSHPDGLALPAAWRQFVASFAVRWEWFCTLTFVDHVSTERAGKIFRALMRRLNRELYGSHYERKRVSGVFWVLAWEHQKRGVLHCHAIIGDSQPLQGRVTCWRCRELWRAFGPPTGFAQIEVIKCQDAVRQYLTKHVSNGGQIDVSPSLRRLLNNMD